MWLWNMYIGRQTINWEPKSNKHLRQVIYSIENESIAKCLKFESIKNLNDLSEKHKLEQNSLCEKMHIWHIINSLSPQTESERIYFGCIVDNTTILNIINTTRGLWMIIRMKVNIKQSLLLKSYSFKHKVSKVLYNIFSLLKTHNFIIKLKLTNYISLTKYWTINLNYKLTGR